jgi:hypothetical protein
MYSGTWVAVDSESRSRIGQQKGWRTCLIRYISIIGESGLGKAPCGSDAVCVLLTFFYAWIFVHYYVHYVTDRSVLVPSTSSWAPRFKRYVHTYVPSSDSGIVPSPHPHFDIGLRKSPRRKNPIPLAANPPSRIGAQASPRRLTATHLPTWARSCPSIPAVWHPSQHLPLKTVRPFDGCCSCSCSCSCLCLCLLRTLGERHVGCRGPMSRGTQQVQLAFCHIIP